MNGRYIGIGLKKSMSVDLQSGGLLLAGPPVSQVDGSKPRMGSILPESAATPLIIHCLIEQFFVKKYKDIIPKYSETFPDRYGNGRLVKFATRLE